METNEFLNQYVSRGRAIVNYIHGWPYYQYQKLAAMTKHYNFDCGFDESGVCSYYQTLHLSRDAKRNMCCCHSCYSNMGYLEFLPANLAMIETYADLFHEKVGYWRKDKGCILERKFRSRICLTYNCHTYPHVPKSVKKLFKLLGECGPKELSLRGKKLSSSYSTIQILKDLEAWILEETSKKG